VKQFNSSFFFTTLLYEIQAYYFNIFGGLFMLLIWRMVEDHSSGLCRSKIVGGFLDNDAKCAPGCN
jgi:hypothetical protein